jgi:putative oxidoreductase
MSNDSSSHRGALARLIPRALVGGIMAGHGAQKQFGAFGGYGIQGTGAHFEGLGLKPGELNAQAAAAGELGGGALLVLGLFPTLAGMSLIATMIVALRTAHLEKGLWITDGGYEYNLVMIAAVMAIVDANGGSSGRTKALLALLGGAIASTAVIEAGKRG